MSKLSSKRDLLVVEISKKRDEFNKHKTEEAALHAFWTDETDESALFSWEDSPYSTEIDMLERQRSHLSSETKVLQQKLDQLRADASKATQSLTALLPIEDWNPKHPPSEAEVLVSKSEIEKRLDQNRQEKVELERKISNYNAIFSRLANGATKQDCSSTAATARPQN